MHPTFRETGPILGAQSRAVSICMWGQIYPGPAACNGAPGQDACSWDDREAGEAAGCTRCWRRIEAWKLRLRIVRSLDAHARRRAETEVSQVPMHLQTVRADQLDDHTLLDVAAGRRRAADVVDRVGVALALINRLGDHPAESDLQ